MKISAISKQHFLDWVYTDSVDFIERLSAPDVFIIKEFYPRGFISELRNQTFEWGLRTESSWHPLYDGCPDYHRLHDNYPQAYVRQKFHGFYRHNYYEHNARLFASLRDIFELKNYLGGFNKDSFFKNIPSDGVIPRVNVHHYPKGGGYQAEHLDPAGPFAKIQTLIVASQIGIDYKDGGVYARPDINSDKQYIDEYSEIGDMIVMSPAIPHGVDPIDTDCNYTYQTNDGRWIILPLFLFSDYPREDNLKPRQL